MVLANFSFSVYRLTITKYLIIIVYLFIKFGKLENKTMEDNLTFLFLNVFCVL